MSINIIMFIFYMPYYVIKYKNVTKEIAKICKDL